MLQALAQTVADADSTRGRVLGAKAATAGASDDVAYDAPLATLQLQTWLEVVKHAALCTKAVESGSKTSGLHAGTPQDVLPCYLFTTASSHPCYLGFGC